MMMREWCLVNKHGSVVNMALSSRPNGPLAAPDDHSWVPIECVSQTKLSGYRFFNEPV